MRPAGDLPCTRTDILDLAQMFNELIAKRRAATQKYIEKQRIIKSNDQILAYAKRNSST